MSSISACLVVYNEEKLIERCLESIKNLVDEIIVVHDGECTDKTLSIAARYTNKIFVREHVGIMEAHMVFAFTQCQGDWILRIDADEYFLPQEITEIKKIVERRDVSAVRLKWEMWNGKRSIYFPGLQKIALFRKDAVSYIAIPHATIEVIAGQLLTVPLVLHHQPLYSNISWKSFWKKTKKWAPIHARYYFPSLVKFETFNIGKEKWVLSSKMVRDHIVRRLLVEPFKVFLGQLKNGLYKSIYGWNAALQQYVYYTYLYWNILKLRNSKGVI